MKSQAETAGRLSASTSAQPQKGTVLRDLELQLPDGTHRLLSAVRGQANLVMVFTAGEDVRPFLNGLSSLNRALKENSAGVLVISLGNDRAPIPALQPDLLSLVIDSTGAIHRALGASDPAHTPVPSVYVTDRFGEVFGAFRAAEPAALPCPEEIVRWLEFINYQCEECAPPEWPE
jgi:peroxiredoxin